MVVALVETVLAGVGLLVLHYGIWRPARQGRYAAIVLLYVFHVLFLLAVPFVALMAVFVIGDGLVSGFALIAGLIVLGIMWLIALTNLFERKLWDFARLDGQCPVCRNWAFGRVRRPDCITCGQCGAVLQFERAS